MHRFSVDGDPVVRTAAVVIAIIMVFAVLKAGSHIFAPLGVAVVAGVILAPVNNQLERLGLSRGTAASAIIVLTFLAIASLAVFVEPVVNRILENLPTIKWELRSLIEQFRGLIRGLDEVNNEVQEALGGDTSGASGDDAGAAMPNLSSALLLAPQVVAQILIFWGALFFFLLTRENIYDWISRFVGSTVDTKIIRQRFATAEKLVSRYFMTISLINGALGVALGAALMLMGLPGALIWGLAAAGMNFIVYIGPLLVTAGLLIAGLVSFDGWISFAPAAIFVMINMIEGQFVTPALVGRSISVNPLLVFVSLIVLLWIWGPLGGIVAIPLLVIVLVMLDIFEEVEVVAEPEAPPEPQAAT